MEKKTNELIGPALDWAVAKAKGYADFVLDPKRFLEMHETGHYNYSTEWAQGGPIIEREGLCVSFSPYDHVHYGYTRPWSAEGKAEDGTSHIQCGATPLIAAMRCYVASKLGASVDIPDELL